MASRHISFVLFLLKRSAELHTLMLSCRSAPAFSDVLSSHSPLLCALWSSCCATENFSVMLRTHLKKLPPHLCLTNSGTFTSEIAVLIPLARVLQPFKARQVHGICADGIIFTEPLGCLTCLYSWVGELHTLQAVCLSACLMSWPLPPSMSPIVAPVPLNVPLIIITPSRESLPV